jgi:hypothetical protein
MSTTLYFFMVQCLVLYLLTFTLHAACLMVHYLYLTCSVSHGALSWRWIGSLLVSCVAVMNVCYIGLFLLYTRCVWYYLEFHSSNASNIELEYRHMRHSRVICFYWFYICSIFPIHLKYFPFLALYDVHCISDMPICQSCAQYMVWISWVIITCHGMCTFFTSGAKSHDRQNTNMRN